jgi:general secretion pathway protein G
MNSYRISQNRSHERLHKRQGFSLVELVVVVLLIGILAAVAAPRMFDTANSAKENGTKQSLSVIRDSIELYKAQNSSYPPAATLSTVLKPFLKGAFPAVQIGANQNNKVSATSQNPIATPEAGGNGWVYNQTTGEFCVNDAAYIAW